MNLFCFPYAGGSAAIFNHWRQYLDPQIALIPVELAGRGNRIYEPLYETIEDAVDDLYKRIKDRLDEKPYVLFGHSLGGLLTYELARKVLCHAIRQPSHLYFSGKASPDVKNDKAKRFHLMDEAQFKTEIIHLGGTPPEFFEHPELMNIFLPLLRNDFRLAETTTWNCKLDPFVCDISVFMGKQDEITAEQTDAWKRHTSGNCTIYYFNGGHFFLHNEVRPIVRIINSLLPDARLQHVLN